jgi:hypothetical protein
MQRHMHVYKHYLSKMERKIRLNNTRYWTHIGGHLPVNAVSSKAGLLR